MKAETLKLLESSVKNIQKAISIYQDASVCQVSENVEPLNVQIKKRRQELLQRGCNLKYESSDMFYIERGDRNPSLRKLNEIAAMLGCHLELVPNDI